MGRCFSNGFLCPEPSFWCLVALFPWGAGKQIKRNVCFLLMTPSHLWGEESRKVIAEVAALPGSNQWQEQHRKGKVLTDRKLPVAISSASISLLTIWPGTQGPIMHQSPLSPFICERVTRCWNSSREHSSWFISKNMSENNTTWRSNTPCWEWN